MASSTALGRKNSTRALRDLFSGLGGGASQKSGFFVLVTGILIIFIGFVLQRIGLSIFWWIPIFVLLIFFTFIPLLETISPTLAGAVRKILNTIIFFSTLAFIIYLIWSLSATGTINAAWTDFTSSELGKTLGATWQRVVSIFKDPQQIANPDVFGWTNPNIEEVEVTKGVSFLGVYALNSYSYEQEPVSLTGVVEIDSLPNVDTQVTFDCTAEVNDETIQGELTLANIGGNAITIHKGQQKLPLSFFCEFPSGFLVPTNATQVKKKIPDYIPFIGGLGVDNEDRLYDIQYYTATVSATYENFATTSSLRVYTIPYGNPQQYNYAKQELQKVNDPYLNSQLRAQTQCLRGCGLSKVILDAPEQPQTELQTKRLRINIAQAEDWYGTIETLKEVNLLLPNNFQLQECTHFGDDATFDNTDENWALVNAQLKNNQNRFSHEFDCLYTVPEPREQLSYDAILSRAVYDYIVKEPVEIKIVRINNAPGQQNA